MFITDKIELRNGSENKTMKISLTLFLMRLFTLPTFFFQNRREKAKLQSF